MTEIINRKTSDGYHTFEELYEHRFTLYVALCQVLRRTNYVFKSRKHSDGSSYPGWFLLGLNREKGKQISYHLPDSWWDKLDFMESAPPEFDGHTSDDVLKRIAEL